MSRPGFLLASIVALSLVFGMTACSTGQFLSAGAVDVPDRVVPVSPKAAAEAEAILEGARRGNMIRLTESQFTSLLVERVRLYRGDQVPLEELTVWFEPERVYLRAKAAGDQLPVGGEVAMWGELAAEQSRLTLSLEQASAGGVSVPKVALDLLNGELSERIQQLDTLDFPIRTLQVERGAVVIERAP